MRLEQGAPADRENRMEKEQRVYDLLEELGIAYQRIDHERAMTMEVCQALEEVLGAKICKNLLLCNRQESRFLMLMMPGEKNFETKVFSKLIGSSRLSFAKGEWMERLLDISPGSLSVMGLMNDQEGKVELFIDRAILEQEYLGCHPCVNTSTLRLRVTDLVERILPRMGHGFTVVEL